MHIPSYSIIWKPYKFTHKNLQYEAKLQVQIKYSFSESLEMDIVNVH